MLGWIVLGGLWRGVILVGRAFGRFRDRPLDFVSDALLMPACVAAIVIFDFSDGTLADRKAQASAIIFIALFWGAVVQWLWWRRRAGPLSLAIRLPAPIIVVFGLCVAAFLCLNSADRWTDPDKGALVTAISVLASIGLAIWMFLAIVAGTEIRKEGCVAFFRFVRWEQIESYAWRPASEGTPDFGD